ncbi:MAG TPA: class I SAM-dependent methyltransferase [Pyrinomonadaceae bacterium]|nr:class I SAM-dependent methyltransferase [Pyrinomonadaceae bacterium]
MSSPLLNEWERVEVERSAAQAAHTNLNDLLVPEDQIQRYLDPSADTCYPLEYSYYLLGDVRGKTVLDYGCGDGANTILLARRGGHVKALDISPELIDIARQRLAVNQITGDVEFIIGSAHDVPLRDDSVDVVFGMTILHHLHLESSAREVKRVLAKGGRAIFREPVRNSKLFKLLRGLIPYRAQDVSPFERPLSHKELAQYADGFSSYRARAFQLPSTNLVYALPPLKHQLSRACHRFDAAALKMIPALSRYATVSVMEMVK